MQEGHPLTSSRSARWLAVLAVVCGFCYPVYLFLAFLLDSIAISAIPANPPLWMPIWGMSDAGNLLPFTTTLIIPLIGIILGIAVGRRYRRTTANSSDERLATIGLTASFLTLFFVLVAFIPKNRGHESNYPLHCLNSQRQLAIAVAVFADDHQGKCPTFAELRQALGTEYRLLDCPEDPGTIVSIGVNDRLVGATRLHVADPMGTVLTADCQPGREEMHGTTDIDTQRHTIRDPQDTSGVSVMAAAS